LVRVVVAPLPKAAAFAWVAVAFGPIAVLFEPVAAD